MVITLYMAVLGFYLVLPSFTQPDLPCYMLIGFSGPLPSFTEFSTA